METLVQVVLRHGPSGPMGPHGGGFALGPLWLLLAGFLPVVAVVAVTLLLSDYDVDPVARLKRRYVRGEIDEGELERRSERLLENWRPP